MKKTLSIKKWVSFAVVSSLLSPAFAQTNSLNLSPAEATRAFQAPDRQTFELFQEFRRQVRQKIQLVQTYPHLKKKYSFIDPRGYIFSSQQTYQEKMITEMEFTKSLLGNSKIVQLKVLKDERARQAAQLRKGNAELNLILGTAIPQNDLTWVDYVIVQIPLVSALGPAVAEKVQAQIAANTAKLAEIEGQQKTLTQDMVRALRELGIEASEQQVESLCATVTADHDLMMISAFDNVRKLTLLIQNELKNGRNSIEIGKEYYAVYVLMLASLIQIYESQINKISNLYLPKVDQLKLKAQANIQDARILLESNKTSESLQTNINLNNQMILILDKYKTYLSKRRDQLKSLVSQRRQSYLEVLNSYNTYDLGDGILGLVKMSQEALSAETALNLSDIPQLMNLGEQTFLDQLNSVTLKIVEK